MKAKMKGGIIQRGKKSWAVVVPLGYRRDPVTGKARCLQKWVAVKGNRNDAKKKQRELLSALDKGTFIIPSKMTFGEWMTEWLEKAVKPPVRRANTYTLYKAMDRNHISPFLGSIPLQKLGPIDLKRFYTTRETLSEASRALVHGIVHASLEDAVREGRLATNPAGRVVGKPRVRSGAEDILKNCWTPDEAAKAITAAKAFGTQVHAIIGLALDSGMRKGELFGLKWADVDLDSQKLTVVRQLLHAKSDAAEDATDWDKQMFGPPKSGRSRVITLASETVTLLRAHKKAQAELKLKNRTVYVDHGLAFAREFADLAKNGERLGMPIQPWNFGPRVFAKVIAAANVKPISFHGLRHTTATMMLAAGVAVHTVARHLGHSSAKMTLDVYSHVLPAMEQDAAARRGRLLHG